MKLKLMKTADLDEVFDQAKADFWHYVKLRDKRIEEEDAKRPLRGDPKEPDDGYVRDIVRLTACVDRASEKMSAVVAERARRAELSNHAMLTEMAMRGAGVRTSTYGRLVAAACRARRMRHPGLSPETCGLELEKD